MSKKKLASPFVYGTLSSLLFWASQNKKRGFFIALCDEDNTHVAFQNLIKVSSDAAATIGCDPELCAAFESIEVGVDIASDDSSKDPEWMKVCNEMPIDEESWRWIGFDFKEGRTFQYKQTAPKKGGAQ